MKRFTALVLVMGVVATALIVLLLAQQGRLTAALGSEAYKLVLQFSLITVVGGLVSALFAEFKREQDQRAAHRAQLLDFYNGALCQYNKSKRVRRSLRALIARALDLPVDEVERRYVDLLERLEDIQLEFESFRRLAGVQGAVFPDIKPIEAHFHRIEEHMRSVVREYEDGAYVKNGAMNLAGPVHLREYVNERRSGGRYVDEVALPFEEVEVALLRALERRT